MADQPIGGVTVEIRAPLDLLKQDFQGGRAETEAFNRQAKAAMGGVEGAAKQMGATASAAVAKLTAAEQKLLQVYQETGKLNAKLVQDVGGYAKAQDLLAKSLLQSAQAQVKLNQAAAQGAKTYEDWLQGSHNFADEWNAQAKAALNAGNAYRLNRAQLQELTAVGRHSLDQLAAGASPITVLGTHAASLAQVLGNGEGGVGGAFKAVTSLLTPFRVGVGLVATATVAATLALNKYNEELTRTEALVQGVGRSAGLSAQQLDQIARRGAGEGGTSVGQAKDLEDALLKTGQVGGEVFEGLIAIQKRYANATGEDLKHAQAELAAMFADPAKGAEELQKRFGSLTASQIEAIRTAQEQGDKTQAQILLMRALQGTVGDVSKSLGGLKGAWDSVGAAASQAGANFLSAAQKAVLAATQGIGALRQLEQFQKQQEARDKANRTLAEFGRASSDTAAEALAADPDRQARQALNEQAMRAAKGVAGAAATNDGAALQTNLDYYQKILRAQATYLDQGEKEHRLAQLQIQENQVKAQKETAATRAKLGEIAAQKKRLELGGQVISSAEVERQVADAAAVASSKQSKANNGHAESLARQAAAMDANARATMALGDAYLKSGEAAFVAESRRKALTDATRKGADAEAQVRRQLAIDIADQYAAAAKSVEGMRAEAEARAKLNDQVAAGVLTSGEANEQLRDEAALRPILIAAAAAEGAQKQKLLDVIRDLRFEQARLNDERHREVAQDSADNSRDQLAQYQKEVELIGKSNAERARGLAVLQKAQELRRTGGDTLVDSAAGKDAIKAAGDAAAYRANQLEAAQAVDAVTKEVDRQTLAYRLNAEVLGMTHAQAEAYRFEQEKLADAAARGITLSDDQKKAIHDLAGAYGTATEAARKLAEQQKAASDAANYLTDSFSTAIEDILVDSKKGSQAVRDLAKELEKALIHGALTGEGPFAGLLGTSRTNGPGQANQGILSQVFGKALGVGQARGQTPAAPLFVQPVSGGGIGGGLGGLFADAKRVTGADITGANGGDRAPFGLAANDNGLSDLIAAQDDAAAKFAQVFQENTSGGFLGGLQSSLSGIGHWLSGLFSGGGGGAGGLGAWFSANQGGLGAIAGSILANVAHEGWDVGRGTAATTRMIDPRLVMRAPRYHNGLAPDEHVAILQDGERVQSRRQVAAERMGGRSLNITIKTPDADSFRRSKRQIGRVMKQAYGLR